MSHTPPKDDAPPGYESEDEAVLPVEFTPNAEQCREFDFTLMFDQRENGTYPEGGYTPESLQGYINNHFFAVGNMYYKWAGNVRDNFHRKLKNGLTYPQLTTFFCGSDKNPSWQTRDWGPYLRAIPRRLTMVRGIEVGDILDVPLTDAEMELISPILAANRSMATEHVEVFEKFLGMKLKHPDDPIPYCGGKYIGIVGPQGAGKSVLIEAMCTALFGAGCINHVSLQAFSKNETVGETCHYPFTLLDDAWSKSLTETRKSNFKVLCTNATVLGNRHNRTTFIAICNPEQEHLLPEQGSRRALILYTDAKYARKRDLITQVLQCLKEHAELYKRYLLCLVRDIPHLEDDFLDMEMEEQTDTNYEVPLSKSDSPMERVMNYIKHDILTNPKKYQSLPYKFPQIRQLFPLIDTLYGEHKVGYQTPAGRLMRSIRPKLRQSHRGSQWMIDTLEQLESLCIAVKISPRVFEALFVEPEPEPEPESAPAPEPEPQQLVTVASVAPAPDAMMEMFLKMQTKMEALERQNAKLLNAQKLAQGIVIPNPNPKPITYHQPPTPKHDLPPKEPEPKEKPNPKIKCKVKVKITPKQ